MGKPEKSLHTTFYLQSIYNLATGSHNHVGLEVLAALSVKMATSWVAAPCKLLLVYQCIRGPYLRTSEMSVNSYQPTWCYNPEDSHRSHNHISFEIFPHNPQQNNA
jgi:hypothetical protein